MPSNHQRTGQFLILRHEFSDELTREHQVVYALRGTREYGFHGLLGVMFPLFTAGAFSRTLCRLGFGVRSCSGASFAVVDHVDGRFRNLIIAAVDARASRVRLSPYINKDVEGGVACDE